MGLRVNYGTSSVATLFLGILLLCAPAYAEDNVRKSPNDSRQYETFQLPNELRVLVISDPETDKGAAALDVFVGSSSDPEDRQGLAHFLEHMLFLGTEKYPKAGEYQEFVAKHGGNPNAYTAFEHTNYFFDIDNDYLEPALDRFAQFFIAPLFTREYVNREKNAVNAEYQSRKKNDDIRLSYAWKQAVNPEHPFARFTVGSLDTLADREDTDVRDELVDFHARHYSANIMALVVLGKEPIPRLKQWVTEKFSAIKNINAKPLDIAEPLFAEGQLPARMNVVPLADKRVMTLTFPIPALSTFYRSKPTHYIANLLGHEGKGSLLSLLKKKGWVDALSAGPGMSRRSEATFHVSMELTREGMHHIDDIASHIFQYLRLIQNHGITQWIFDEQRNISEISFRFQEKPAPLASVRSLAHSLHIFPAEDVLRGPYAMDEYDPGLIRHFLAQLTPDNVFMTVMAKGLETDAKDPWFNTDYQTAPLNAEATQRWRSEAIHPDLAIPEPNIFLPTDLSVKPVKNATSKPVRIKETRGFELWFQQDDTFGLPRADFYFSVRSPRANDSPEHAVLTQLYVGLANDQLNEFSYPAYLAGLSYDLYRHLRGFSVRISGYNDKQELLLSRIVEVLVNLKVRPERFTTVKDELIQTLRNERREPPYTQTASEVPKLLLKPYWTEDQRLAALQRLTTKDLQRFSSQLLNGITVVALAHGNFYREDALALAKVLQQRLKNTIPNSVPRSQVVKLPDAKQYIRQLDIDHPDSAITIYVQGADKSYLARAMVALTTQILSSPFYNDLRTDKQLGYIVSANAMPLLEVPGIAFVVQSPTTDPIVLEDHIERFLSGYAVFMARMSDADFEKHKEGLVARILDKEERLQTRTNRYWRELDQENYDFDSREQLTKAVRSITKQDVITSYEELFLSEKRKRLIVRATGDRHKEAFAAKKQALEHVMIADPDAFAEDKEYFPRYHTAR